MKEMIPRIRLFLCVCFLMLVGLTSVSFGQGAPEQAFQEALRLQNQGNYEEAATAFAQVLENYPTSRVVPEATFRLGYTQYLLGNYDEAIEAFRKILEPPAPQQLQQLGQGMIPQAIAAKASTLAQDDPQRRTTFEEAISEFDKFIQQYPQSDELEAVQYGRALSLYHVQRYDEAAETLRRNLQMFQRSESVLDSQYLLALTLATQASETMREAADAEPPANVASLYDEAERLLQDIIDKGADVALANDAQFQLGELSFNRASFLPTDQRGSLYERAMAAYRRVKPQADMIAAQEQRLENILERMRAVGTAGDQAALRALQRLQEREQAKLAAIRERPDQTITAQIKVAQIFFQMQDYNAARVLLRFLEPHATAEDQRQLVMYYVAMTYALQNRVDDAVASYNALYEAFPAAEVASNLPYLMGVMYLQNQQPQKAVEYFDEQTAKYPDSHVAVETLTQRAAAMVSMGQFDEARETFRKILEGNPRPEVAASAEIGIAEVDRQTNQIEQAIQGYQQVRDKYQGTPQAEQSSFWVAELTRQNGNTRESLPLYQAFLEQHPESQLAPTALFGLAQAQMQTGDAQNAVATYQRLIEQHQDSEPAQYAHFQLRSHHASQGDPGKMVEVMNQFIERYPDNANVYFAYDSVAQAAINEGDLPRAIGIYQKLVDEQPQNPQTPQALLKVAQLWRQYADLQGRYLALNEEQRAEWEKGVTNSIAAAEELLRSFPESELVAMALQTLMGDQQLLLTAKKQTAEDVQGYFRGLAEQFAENAGTRSKILFTLAGYLSETDEEAALALMSEAYDPQLKYAPGDMDLYGQALIDQNRLEDALQVFQKLTVDYPNPEGVDPQQAPPQIMEAQSIALYGRGRVLQEQGQTAQAGELFDRLKRLYPWSPKILEASYGIAQAQFAEKQYDDAIVLLTQIIRAPTAPVELRANAMLLGGRIQEERGEIESAIDYYGKIARFYEAVRPVAAEGLWKAGQLIEQKQVPTLTDAQKRTAQLQKAINFYRELVNVYAESPFAEQAGERLRALSPQ